MGQLGDGTDEDSSEPVAVVGDHTFTQLSAGRYFTCGLDEDGAAWCWGDNASGELGNGATGAGGPDENQGTSRLLRSAPGPHGCWARRQMVCFQRLK
jgi:alpha-tubulin suppressor-like RCC1 family protein